MNVPCSGMFHVPDFIDDPFVDTYECKNHKRLFKRELISFKM